VRISLHLCAATVSPRPLEELIMPTSPSLSSSYDVIVCGARPAGAGTAMLLARQGLRVLMIDRGRHGTDILSTHALMRAGVLQLARWGVLPAIVDAGTPAVRSAAFVYAGDETKVPIKPRDGVDALFAPRRTVLDRALVDAAVAAGVTVSYGTTFLDVLRTPAGRVGGIVVQPELGQPTEIHANLVIGADGLHSLMARRVGADVRRTGRAASAVVYGYWPDVPGDGYRWHFDMGVSAGIIPTNDGLTCIFASVPAARFAEVFKGDVGRGHRDVLSVVAPDVAASIAGRPPAAHLHGFSGERGFLRRATGPGWALVGDAAYFKDPLTAHGITDALVEAEYLTRAIAAGTDAALEAYALDRDRRVGELFDVTDRIASFAWTLDEARALHKQLAAAMAEEVTALREFTSREAAVA
jgi:flavin-dependent dehydrogenase